MSQKERIPREKRPEVLAKMVNAKACRIASDNDIWHVLCSTLSTTTWAGLKVVKNHFDMRRYFEILRTVRPEVIVETGLQNGGSAAFFMDCCVALGLKNTTYVGIDISCSGVPQWLLEVDFNAVFIQRDCLAYETVELVKQYVAGKKSLIVLDSVHSEEHVTEELRLYAPLCKSGDVLVIEDTDHNGHPVLSDYGPSAWEAVEKFMKDNTDFRNLYEIEGLYGPFTNSPRGWLEKL